MTRTVGRHTILLVTPSYGRDGGVASHVTSTAAALHEAGFDVAVLAARSDPGTAREVTIRELPELESAPASASSGTRFRALIHEIQPDLVHFHDVADPGFVSMARAEAPTVASVHGYAGCTPNTYYFRPGQECHRPHGPGCIPNMAFRGCAHTHDPRGLLGRYRATTQRLSALRQVDHLVVYSGAMVRHLRRNDLERCSVVPLFARPAASVVPPPRERRILFAGRIVGAKGLGVLLRAARGLDCSVDVHGEGWWLPRARKQAAKTGIANRVLFHGWTDERTLAKAYDDCRVMVVPSLWPEPFGLVGIEAMTHGRPVVASDTGGVREWLIEGETGYLVPPGDPVALRAVLGRMLDDPDLCTQLGQAGATRSAEFFSPAAHVSALERVYADARARWRRSPAPS